jgi:endoglucanase
MALLAATIKNCLVALALLVWLAAPSAAASFSMKRGINLDIWITWPDEERWGEQDVLLPFPEWRKNLRESDFEALKDTGFDFVRIPVDPSPFLSEKTAGFREKLFASILESVQLVNQAGLKAVVDMHLFPAGGNRSIGMGDVMDDPAMFERYVEFVRTMARILSKEDPSRVAFEPMNEPVLDCDEDKTNLWPERLKRLHAAARSSATRLTLVLTGACLSGAEALARIDPKDFPDDNIIWTFHSYWPFLLTHQGASWAGDFIQYVTGLPYPPSSVPRAELDTALEAIRQKIKTEAPWARRSGMLAYLDEQIATSDTKEELDALMDEPFRIVEAWAKQHAIASENIFLGEFGMIRQEYGNPYVVPAASRAAYVSDMIGRAERRGYAWSVWSYGGAFGVVEEFDERKAEPDVLEMVRALR